MQSTNPIERINGRIKRRIDVVGIFPDEAAVVRLVGAILLEQSGEWVTQRARYMTLKAIGALGNTPSHRQPVRRASLTRQHTLAGTILSLTALWEPTRDGLPTFTPDECANYIRAAGYGAD